MQKLADALRAKQDESGLSLRGLARALGVSVGAAEGWLKGWRKPDWDNVPPLAEFLGESEAEIVSWILGDRVKPGYREYSPCVVINHILRGLGLTAYPAPLHI